MNKFVTSLAAATAVLLGTAAHAQSQTSAFNGPFVGVQGGWEERAVNNPSSPVGPVPLTGSTDTGTLGVMAGYDKQIGSHFVLGTQAELNFPISDTYGNGIGAINPKRSVDLTARAGTLLGDKTLAYVRGGYSNERVGESANGLYASQSRDGWLLGAGVERAVTQHASARAEYRYTDFSNGDGKFDRHQVLIGAVYHF